jgi:hypothetical protein
MELCSHWTDFHDILYLRVFRKSVEKIQVWLKSDKYKWYFIWRQIYILQYLAHFFLEWDMFQTKVVEKVKTRIGCSVIVFRKSCRLWENVEKYCTVGQATDDNIAHAHRILDTWGYEYTHSGCAILIVFPLQKWLHDRASMLRYKCIDMIWYDIWNDMIYLTPIRLAPGSSGIVHIYTQTIYRTTQSTQTIQRTQFTN